ncbi:MAG TPA: DUF1343 domain-containing protein, partial [Acidobacteriota bacterium]|nr:DUF1343 domain-containing protein [Acidobacteriota bacterium]
CLIEGTNLSEGRGTTRPFEWVGAPWLDAEALVERLDALQLPGVRFRPQVFQPTFSKYAGQRCNGLQVHVLDRDQFDPLATALHLIAEIRSLHPDRLTFRDSHFDRLIGASSVRRALLAETPVEQIVAPWKGEGAFFDRRRRAFLIY